MKQLPTGVMAPDFELHTLGGEVFRLSEAVLGGPVVVAFYKVSCPTCQFTLPYLQRIYSEIGISSKVKIRGISQDDALDTTGFSERFGISFDSLIDPHPYLTSSAYGIEYVPALFVVDSDMRIKLSDYGFSKAALSEVARIVAEGTRMGVPELFSANDGVPATRPG